MTRLGCLLALSAIHKALRGVPAAFHYDQARAVWWQACDASEGPLGGLAHEFRVSR